jgi:3-deoxy-D-manno-octulosonate 8-phosphate phosphatase KdsC-like HAD superfamily phosphatase
MSNIKLVVSEIDGVITDGRQPIDELGNTSFKNFFMADFEAINKIKAKCPFVFISNDNSISYNFCRSKNIPFYWAPKDKRQVLSEILRRYNVTADDTLYIGSKLSDIPCMRMIPNSFCTNKPDPFGFTSPSADAGQGVLIEIYLKHIA